MKKHAKYALTAFLFHAPGLRILQNFELDPNWKIRNRIALLLTLGLATVSGWYEALGPSMRSFVIVWIIGHFLWSIILASIFLFSKLSIGKTRQRTNTLP